MRVELHCGIVVADSGLWCDPIGVSLQALMENFMLRRWNDMGKSMMPLLSLAVESYYW